MQAADTWIAETAERHINRFVNSLRESPVKTMLYGESFSSAKDLERKLRLYETCSQPARPDGPMAVPD